MCLKLLLAISIHKKQHKTIKSEHILKYFMHEHIFKKKYETLRAIYAKYTSTFVWKKSLFSMHLLIIN